MTRKSADAPAPGRVEEPNRMIVTDETIEAASAETARLQRELDITNADHIALWIEANTLPDEPMNQCASWLACRIVEAHEATMKAMDLCPYAEEIPPIAGEDAVERGEFLPCPFCGDHPKFESYGPGACFRIYCEGPNCTAYPSVRKYSNGDAPDKATRAWNTRAVLGLEALQRERAKPILLEMAEADEEQQLWERRFAALYRTYPSWRTADSSGSWGLRDFLAYAAKVCGFKCPPEPKP